MVVPTALGAFVMLGASASPLGVAWPSIRSNLQLPLSALGLLLATAGAGYLCSTMASGFTIGRLGTRRTLLLASATSGLALAIFAITPDWWGMVAASLLLGLAGGAVDAGLNSFIALRYPAAVMNLLHASWGAGALAGPVLLTAVLVRGASWRIAFAALAATQLALLAALLPQRAGWQKTRPARPRSNPRQDSSPEGSLPLAIWLSLLVLFVYTGVETSAGQWSYSLLTESRGQSPAAAGLAVAAYWAALTGGRLVAAVVSRHLASDVLLHGSMALSMAGAVVLWWSPNPTLGSVGLGLLGAGLAAVFPTLVWLTPARVGARRTSHTVGYQIAAAYVGGTVLPALAGPMLQGWGLEALGPAVLASVITMAGLNLAATARPRPG